jgi:hypothetical protein
MATVTNKALNTATLTNKEIMVESSGTTWDEANFTWDAAQGTWASPISITNKSINIGSLTNKAHQDP